jgi:DnaJ domain
MINYYEILELSVGSEPAAIRAAFRRLAKKYHPDVSIEPNASARFREIQEAYEFLMDDAQRFNFNNLWNQRYANRQEQFRREQIYKLWVEHQQRKHQTQRTQTQVYDKFQKVEKLSRFWQGVHWFFNVFFMILFTSMIILPLHKYFHQDELELALRKPFIFFVWPMLIGCTFLGLGYYFWFVVKTDQPS